VYYSRLIIIEVNKNINLRIVIKNMDNKLITIAIVSNHMELALITSILDNYEITYFVDDQYIDQIYSTAVGKIKVNILKDDYDKVSALLKEHNYPFIDYKNVKKDINIFQQHKNLILIVIILLVLLSSYIFKELLQKNNNEQTRNCFQAYDKKIKELIKSHEIASNKHYQYITDAKINCTDPNDESDIYYFLMDQTHLLENNNKTETEIYGIILGDYALAANKEFYNFDCSGYNNLQKSIKILKKYNNNLWKEYQRQFLSKKRCE
jgi:hypothetical protein